MPAFALSQKLPNTLSVFRKFAPVFMLIVLAMMDFTLALRSGYTFDVSAGLYIQLFVLLGISVAYGVTARSRRISNMAYYGALWVAFTMLGAIFTYLMAAIPLPLLDETFTRMDASLGFHWLDWYNFLKNYPVLNKILWFGYVSLLIQICFSIVYFSHVEKTERLDELLWMAAISLLLTTLLACAFPAAGTFHHFGVDLNKAVHLPHFFALRDGSMTVFKTLDMQGIVTFPSYHTVLAILFIYAFRGCAFWFLPFCIVNFIMLLSTPSHGGHYLVDMIAGGFIAAFTIYFVRYVQRKLKPGASSIA